MYTGVKQIRTVIYKLFIFDMSINGRNNIALKSDGVFQLWLRVRIKEKSERWRVMIVCKV